MQILVESDEFRKVFAREMAHRERSKYSSDYSSSISISNGKLRGRNDSPSSTSSHNDTSRKIERRLPTLASCWRRENLNDVGVCYHEGPSDLQHLLSLIKNRRIKGLPEHLPEISLKLIEFTKEVFTLSFKFSSLADVVEEELKLSNLIHDLDSIVQDLISNNEDIFKNSRNRRAFNKWCGMMAEFLASIDRFISRWETRTITKGTFTQLFMQFSRICLLVPELGDAYKGRLKIHEQEVVSVPDVRFYTYPKNKSVTIVTVTEVIRTSTKGNRKMKKCEVCRLPQGEEQFHIGMLPSSILGQHGAELLLEIVDSYCRPGVSGMICIGTKIIFTYLETNLDDICTPVSQEEEEVVGAKPTILYTRPYDFMDVHDRNEILDFLFWLGYVQSSEYQFL